MNNTLKRYSPQVQEYITNIIDDLKIEIGELPKHYDLQIDLLATSVDIYLKAYDDICRNGITITDSRGGIVKNPSSAIWNAAALTISKILNQFILTRSAKAKLKDQGEEPNSPIDEFI